MTRFAFIKCLAALAGILWLCSCGGDALEGAGPNEDETRPATVISSASLWQPPASSVLYLADQLCETSGAAETRTGLLARFDSDDVSSWAVQRRESAVLFSSPVFEPRLESVARILVKVRTDGARSIRITPFVDSGESAGVQRKRRSVTVPIEHGRGDDEERLFLFEVGEVIHDNWDDLGDGSKVERIEIMLAGGSVAAAEIHEIVIEDTGARYHGVPAGTLIADSGGALRPSWFVAGGVALRCKVRVPADDAELRFHFAADGPLHTGKVRILDEDGNDLTERTFSFEEGWTFLRLTVEREAGEETFVEWSAEGGGTLLVGEPRILRPLPAPPSPSVLVYMIDTLRADYLGAWGRTQAVSPHIDRLAREGLHFAYALSTSCWTKPAIPTLMTGIRPTVHRIGERTYSDRLPKSVDLLQQRFRSGGWRSASFVSNPLGTTLSALERGFSVAFPPRYWAETIGPLGHPSSANLHDSLLEWIDEEPDRPFFAYVHTLEVHEWQQEQYSKNLEPGRTPYDAAIEDQDRHLGDLLDALASRGKLDDLLIVLLSDHGEAFGEHRQEGHGLGLYQTQIHIPLVFWSRRAIPSRRIEHVVGLSDVAPTLLEWVGLPALQEADGKSLARYAHADDAGPVHSFVPAALLRYVWRPRDPQQFSLVDDELQKVIRWSTGRTESYDLRTDPHELSNKPSPPSSLLQELERWIRADRLRAEAFVSRHGEVSDASIDPGDLERLRSLGYVE